MENVTEVTPIEAVDTANSVNQSDIGKQRSIEDYEKEIRELRKEAKDRRLNEKKLSEQLTSYETEKQERERLALEESGKFKELYEKQLAKVNQITEELKAKAEIAEKYIQSENAKREELLKKIPENIREQFTNDSVEKIEQILQLIKPNNDTPQGIIKNNLPNGDIGKPKYVDLFEIIK